MADFYSFQSPTQDADWEAFQAYRQRQSQFASTDANPDLAQGVASLAAHYPTMQPGVSLALAQAGVKPGDAMAETAAANSAQAAQQKVKNKGWFHDLFNSTIRGGMTALSSSIQELQGTARTFGGNIEKYGVAGGLAAPFTQEGRGASGVMAQTDVGQIVNAAQSGQPVDTGSGFFVNRDSGVGQAQGQATRDAWTIDGHGATLGRAVAGAIAEPDTGAYNILSGALDFANTFADPANVAGGEISKLRYANKLFQPVSGAKVSVLSKDAKLSAGLLDADRPAVSSDIARNWLDSRVGRAVTENLVDITSPTDVRNAMKKKVDMETAVELADARTPEAVRQIIEGAAVDGRLREKPYTNGITTWKPTMQAGYELRRRLEDVRLFSSLPNSAEGFLLADGTQSADQLDRTLKNANYSVEDTRKWTDQVARASSREDRRTIIINALADIDSKLSGKATADLKPGDAVRLNSQNDYGNLEGINKDLGTVQVAYRNHSTGEVTKVSHSLSDIITQDADIRGQAFKGLTRLYKDSTDGFQSYNLDDVGKEKGIEGLTINDEGHSIAQPVMWSQLNTETLPGLSRKQIIDIRRETSSPALRRILTDPKYQGLADATKFVGDKWRDATLLRGAYTLRVVGEEQLRLAANQLDSLFSFHPLSAIAWAIGDKTPTFKAFGQEFDVRNVLKGRGTTDAWGNEWSQQAEEEGALNKWQKSHMQAHAGKQWAMNTNFDGFTPVSRGNEAFTAGWSRELSQQHADPLVRRLAGGWKEDDGVRLTGNDVEDAKEWFWNGKGQEYRLDHAARGGQWANLAEDRALSDHYVQSINDSVLAHKTGNDPELRDLIAYGVIPKDGKRVAASRDEVKAFLEQKSAQNIGPEVVRAHATDITPEKVGHYSNAVNHLFDTLITKPSNFLSRSTAFRQYYWERMAELTPELSKEQQALVLENAAKANIDPRRMSMLTEATKRGSGDLGLDSADLLAKSHSLDATKKLLYDLGDRSQFFDQAKIVAPFGEAWKEAMQTWIGAFSRNPTQMYRLKQTVDGAKGSGFFYTDENGNEVFNYPLSGQMSQFFTGTYTPLKGQVSGLNLAGSGVPGLGPVIQIGAAELIKSHPNKVPDFIAQQLLPTGNPDYNNGIIEAFFPGWSKRAITAMTGQTTDNRQWGTTVGQIARYKLSTGQYDISSEPGMAHLEADSKKAANHLYWLRALAQFVAPTAPSPEWMAKDKDGHMWTAAKLMQDFREMQSNKDIGYEHAEEAFLQQYGENALLYMQPLSQGGFSPTTDLHQWVKQNPQAASAYKDVYGYFAGPGGQYSNTEYERQVAMGERTKLTSRQVLELGNQRVAALQYARARDLVGPTPNAQSQEFLRNIQQTLIDKYPGYNPGATTRKSTDYLISQIESAVNADSSIRDSQTGQAAVKYLQLRNVIAQAVPGFKTSNGGASARAALRSYGDGLAAASPEFSRMWVDLLQRELKTDVAATA